MLVEISCELFRQGPLRFSEGLNVVLGDDKATNSIGKSSALMVVDFVFGGSSLLSYNKDVVKELGNHEYNFVFRFAGESYRFKRRTADPEMVYVCDETFSVVRAMSEDQYTSFLKRAYGLETYDLTFRALVGLFLRVWGKDNLTAGKPLHAVQSQRPSECVDNLLKAFDLYGPIRESAQNLARLEQEGAAFRAIKKHQIVPVVGKREYVQNEKRIAELESELSDIKTHLARYATNLSAVVNKEVLELKTGKDLLLSKRLLVANRLSRIQRNLQNTRVLRSDSFRDLTEFFPDVNRERLEKVEDFHNGVAKLLIAELKESESQDMQQLNAIDTALEEIDAKMAAALSSVEQPDKLVDHVFQVATSLSATRDVNERFRNLNDLTATIKAARSELSEVKAGVVKQVEDLVNAGMNTIVSDVFGASRKSPKLTLTEKNYSFEVFEDTGTGTAYAGLVVFDLAVFLATRLPVIAHDSVLFKNIENDSVSKLLHVYTKTQKQSFIALDEPQKYGSAAAQLLQSKSVVELSDSSVLYIQDWRRPSSPG